MNTKNNLMLQLTNEYSGPDGGGNGVEGGTPALLFVPLHIHLFYYSRRKLLKSPEIIGVYRGHHPAVLKLSGT
jgi:hypothetical protein